MNDKRIALRPTLNLSSNIQEESFQNVTLRPILKLQHNLIIMVFLHFCEKQKINISNLKKESFQSEVTKLIKKNTVLRNQLIGLVLGQFTEDEFTQYTKEYSEFNKRILTMIGQRINDSQSQL